MACCFMSPMLPPLTKQFFNPYDAILHTIMIYPMFNHFIYSVPYHVSNKQSAWNYFQYLIYHCWGRIPVHTFFLFLLCVRLKMFPYRQMSLIGLFYPFPTIGLAMFFHTRALIISPLVTSG